MGIFSFPLTWGSFRRMPAVWMSSQPRMRRSNSVSRSRPSSCEGVWDNLLSGRMEFSRLITIWPYILAGFVGTSSALLGVWMLVIVGN